MGTTALSSLQASLATLIGDSNSEYSSNYKDAINNASKEISNNLFIPLDNTDLITGNILPPFNWATSSTLDKYTEPTGTLAKNTDKTYIWNGSTSAKVTASGANDKILLSSTSYRRILDQMDNSVDLKCWVYPEVADDAFLKIKTWQADGTAQELDSTTTTYAGKKNLIELEDQDINDDLSLIEIWLYVATDTKYSYFDMPRLIGKNVREYLLPKDLQDGHLCRVEIQTSSHSDDACDDLHPTDWETVYGWKIIEESGEKYLRLPAGYSQERQIRLIGYKVLETLSATTDTISLDGEQVNLLLAYAASKLFHVESQALQYTIDTITTDISDIDTDIDTENSAIDTEMTAVATISSRDISRYDAKIKRISDKIERLDAKRNRYHQKRAETKDRMLKLKERSLDWLREYYRLLPSLGMTPPSITLNIKW